MNTDNEVTRPRLAAVNRSQMVMRAIVVERLIDEDHGARLIWALGGAESAPVLCRHRGGGGSGGERAYRSSGQNREHMVRVHVYRPPREACRSCALRDQCAPRQAR